MATGCKETSAGDLVKLLRSNAPENLWYTKAVLDHLIFNQLQEWASPGYLDRMQARAEKTYGQTYWWKPDEGVPSEAPDLSQAVAHSKLKARRAKRLRVSRGRHGLTAA